MANNDVKVSALNSVSTLSTDDLSLETVVDELSETGYTSKKITEGAKASQYLEAFTFANLNTTAKTIVGAINEAATTGGADEFIIHMTDTTVTETAADIIDAFDGGSEIWLESQITGETVKTRLPLLAYISDSSQLVLRFSGITYANNRYRYCDVQMLRSPEQIVGRQNVNVAFAVIDDAATSSASVWSSQKTAGELADKAEIDDSTVSTASAWTSSRIASFLPTDTASGAVANFPDGADGVPVDSLVATIDYKDTTGFNAASIIRTGKNLFNKNTIVSGKRLLFTGEEQSQLNYGYSDFIKIKSGVSYYFVGVVGANGWYSIIKYDNKKNCLGHTNIPGGASASGAVTFEQDGYIRVNFLLVNVDDIQIELGSTATAYEPYTGETVEINLDGTIYGGSVDVTNGTVTSTKAQDGTDLPDPVVTTIDPTMINTLKGVNNIWADTGDVTVTYRADVQLYIDSRLSSGTRSLSLAKAPVEEETKQEEQEGGNNER